MSIDEWVWWKICWDFQKFQQRELSPDSDERPLFYINPSPTPIFVQAKQRNITGSQHSTPETDRFAIDLEDEPSLYRLRHHLSPILWDHKYKMPDLNQVNLQLWEC